MRHLFCLVMLSLVPTLAHARQPSPKAHIIKNRAQAQRLLGPHAAQRIPHSFDFTLFSLVWLSQPTDEDAALDIQTLSATAPHRSTRGTTGLTVERKRHTVHIEVWLDRGPCSGGIAKPEAVLRDCRARVSASIEAAKRTRLLWATPRHKLKRAVVTTQLVPGRPSAPPRPH